MAMPPGCSCPTVSESKEPTDRASWLVPLALAFGAHHCRINTTCGLSLIRYVSDHYCGPVEADTYDASISFLCSARSRAILSLRRCVRLERPLYPRDRFCSAFFHTTLVFGCESLSSKVSARSPFKFSSRSPPSSSK